ncbi:MAG: hypothetical protein H6541_13245 [Lentimicrobiaceae bacterium]|nr:hypothetical protein [Lentimicrobiaceae bacterium]MCB9024353.1 hypothetical protein [Lentimicrobiaceae bacterium]
MLRNSEISGLCTPASAYSFETVTHQKRNDSLYRQIMNSAQFRPGEIVLELNALSGAGQGFLASINLVNANPLGGLPLLVELSRTEVKEISEIAEVKLNGTDESFDAVILMGVFNQLAFQADAVKRIAGMVYPHGRLIIADQWFRKAGPMLASLLESYRRKGEIRIYSPSFVSRVLRSSGFSHIATWPAGATNFFCIASSQNN